MTSPDKGAFVTAGAGPKSFAVPFGNAARAIEVAADTSESADTGIVVAIKPKKRLVRQTLRLNRDMACFHILVIQVTIIKKG